MNSIGLVFPITRGSNGYFDQSYDSLTQVKTNIINLLRTNSGERRMQPNFSGGLQELIFEQNMQTTPELITQVIQDKINAWIPGVQVQNVDISMSDSEKNALTDSYKVYIKLSFIYNNQSDQLTLGFTSTNI